jgi:hypothetical protein
MAYKVLGQVSPSAATLTDVYTVPASTSAVLSSIVVCNRSSTPTTFRVGIAVAGAATDVKQYIAYDAALEANEVWTYTVGVTLAATDVVRIYATLATVSCNVFGEEIT